MVSSVHAFAQSPIGKYFTTFLAIGVAATVYLILDRLDYLKSEAQLESVVSRESSFMFNNLILMASCFAVLWGTLFPIISEAVSGEKISLDPAWFNRLMIPIGLFLLFLTGVGPLFAWRRTSTESLRRNFLIPGIASCALVVALIAAGIREFYPLISFGFCLFVALTVIAEFYKGARAISSKNQINFAHAVVELTHRNTRRYGGYIVHMGIVLMFIGWTGAAFNKDLTATVKIGEPFKIGPYELKVKAMNDGDNENFTWQSAAIDVSKNGAFIETMEPKREFYKASRQPVGRVAIRRRMNEDLYLNFAQMQDDKAVIQAYIFPLVSWIWTGGIVLIFGTLVALVPSKIKLQYARTEVVGFTKKHVPVEQ
jgi:cytochrome c-type biogenesis protein CcmF